ncbi:hypothetical protein [Cohnella hashimotonis]|uniref:Uncharacterized protein n=1 Tax=Cohnella hashimotonis TaxID=2826895 RepID=A0ABT6TDL3_9BACL|nr:hypothetical protein [Cohnella hashimotonis]MDI4644916.1 hypothetical protein [Cohnella hashimotonis]
MEAQFALDGRLGIPLPRFDMPWEEMNVLERAGIVERWELIRGRIPDTIMAREAQIRCLLAELFEEEDFVRCCSLNAEIAEAASVIHDLQIWYRTQQDLEEENIKRHG